MHIYIGDGHNTSFKIDHVLFGTYVTNHHIQKACNNKAFNSAHEAEVYREFSFSFSEGEQHACDRNAKRGFVNTKLKLFLEEPNEKPISNAYCIQGLFKRFPTFNHPQSLKCVFPMKIIAKTMKITTIISSYK